MYTGPDPSSFNTGGSSGGGGGFNWSSLFSGLGGIGSIIGGLMQSAGYSQTIGGLTNSLNQIIGPETQDASQLINQYESQVVPDLQSSYGTATQEQGQSYGTAGNYAGSASGAAGALQANPYLGQQSSTIGGLLNYKSFTPQEEAALTTGAGAAAASAAKTIASQTGGTPNAALLEEQEVGQAGATASQTAVQLGSIASQQHLGAMEAALQGQETQSGQYIQQENDAAGVYAGLSSEYAGLSESELNAALEASNIQSGELNVGSSMLGNAGSDITSLLQQVYGADQSSGGGMGGITSGLTSLAGLFGL